MTDSSPLAHLDRHINPHNEAVAQKEAAAAEKRRQEAAAEATRIQQFDRMAIQPIKKAQEGLAERRERRQSDIELKITGGWYGVYEERMVHISGGAFIKMGVMTRPLRLTVSDDAELLNVEFQLNSGSTKGSVYDVRYHRSGRVSAQRKFEISSDEWERWKSLPYNHALEAADERAPIWRRSHWFGHSEHSISGEAQEKFVDMVLSDAIDQMLRHLGVDVGEPRITQVQKAPRERTLAEAAIAPALDAMAKTVALMPRMTFPPPPPVPQSRFGSLLSALKGARS